MDREECLDWLCRLRSEIYVYMPKEWIIPMNNALDMAIEALEQTELKPSYNRDKTELDAISRQAALDLCERFDGSVPYSVLSSHDMLPSVSTEKTGRWEWLQYDCNPNIGNWHCSECNRIVCGAITAASPVYSYKYCPNCGAKMEVEE